MFLGTLFAISTKLSKSPILFIILVLIVLYFFKGIKKEEIIKLFSIVVLLFSAVVLITVFLQRRRSNIFNGFYYVLESYFRYNSISFYLADYAIEATNNFGKSLFPFFGYLSERILFIFFDIPSPIAVPGANFVSEFKEIGNGLSANVLYPWWAWFYGSFGLLGLFIKGIYVFSILTIFIKFKMPILFFYFTYLLMFSSLYRHPIINSDNLYGILGLVLLDITLKFLLRVKKSL